MYFINCTRLKVVQNILKLTSCNKTNLKHKTCLKFVQINRYNYLTINLVKLCIELVGTKAANVLTTIEATCRPEV